jgi:hypothetical protein
MTVSEFSSAPLVLLLDALPSKLRSSISGYLERVGEHVPTIFEDAGVPMTIDAQRDFMFAVAVRKLWSKVNSQYWTMTSAVSLLRGFGVAEAAVGGARYSRSSADYIQVRTLHDSLASQLRALGLDEVANAPSLRDLVTAASNHG